ncbi:MAG: hypothetical protein D6786_06470 [Gammaproteobacteria bacterium]|nr:MAG: hypothetical protein D6786_06470 [Gammaproteobacteria bacterium]
MNTRTTLSILVATGLLAVSGIGSAADTNTPKGLMAVWGYSRGPAHVENFRQEYAEVSRHGPRAAAAEPWRPGGLAAVWSYSRGEEHLRVLKQEHEAVQQAGGGIVASERRYRTQGFFDTVYAADHGLGS